MPSCLQIGHAALSQANRYGAILLLSALFCQCRASIAPVNNARKLGLATFQAWQKLPHIQAYAIGCLLQRT
jgi:hypothetical protein